MIKDTEAWQAWEREQVRNTPVDFEQNARILDAKIKFAKAINTPLDHRAMRDHT